MTLKLIPHLPKLLCISLIIFLSIYLLPLTHFRTNLAGIPSDPLGHAWLMDWFCHHFFQRDFINHQLFAPHGINMANNYDSPFPYSLSCPLSLLGPVAQFNALAAFQLLLIFLSAGLIAYSFLKNTFFRFSFILLYSFSTFTLTRMVIHQNILSTVWSTPLVFYAFYRLDLNRRRQTIISFLLLAVTYLSSWQNIANLTFLVIILLASKIPSYRSATLKKPLLNLIFGIVASLLLFLPFAWPIITESGQAILDLEPSPKQHAEILSYLIPPDNHFTASILPRSLWTNHHPEQYLNLDFSILLLLSLALIFFIHQTVTHRRTHSPQSGIAFPINSLDNILLILAALYFVLSLGSWVTVFGRLLLPLPYYDLLARVPPLLMTRVPARLGIIVIFTLTLFTLRYWERHLPRFISRYPQLRFLPVCLLIWTVITTTIGSHNFQHPVFAYADTLPQSGLYAIKNDPRPGYILHIPTAVDVDQNQLFLQTIHRKPLLTGYASYRALDYQTLSTLNSDPLLSTLDCHNSNPPYSDLFRQNDLVSISSALYSDLNRLQVNYLILNPYLLLQPGCEPLSRFVQTILPQIDYLRLIDRTTNFLILQINPHQLP